MNELAVYLERIYGGAEIVRCMDCGWQGAEGEMSVIDGLRYCPKCGGFHVYADEQLQAQAEADLRADKEDSL